jgi:LacI family transcriptional regulator
MGVSIRTIAEKACVSVATVSRVINDSDKVKATTRKRVLDVISELNYEVNAVARSLKLSKTKTVGLITGNILSSYWSIVARAIHGVAKRNGYNIILCCNDDETPEEELNYLAVLKSSRVDGIILSPTQKNVSYIKDLIHSGMKIVFIDRMIDDIECEAVLIDDEAGAYKGVNYLIQQGYRRIAFINGPRGILTAEERLKGYRRALHESGILADERFIRSGTWKKESGEQLADEILRGPVVPDAIFTANVELALGVLLIAKKLKIRIPEEIGLMAFSDYEWTTIIDPPLTVVDFPISEIGEKGIELLLNKIENPSTGNKKTVIKVETEIKVRGSTRNVRH